MKHGISKVRDILQGYAPRTLQDAVSGLALDDWVGWITSPPGTRLVAHGAVVHMSSNDSFHSWVHWGSYLLCVKRTRKEAWEEIEEHLPLVQCETLDTGALAMRYRQLVRQE